MRTESSDERLREEQRTTVIPGEIVYGDGDIILNEGAVRPWSSTS